MLTGRVRIIGGEWRSQQLRFPIGPSIQPTPDRVRETLFNWLSPIIEGAYCLDLFAGSGALGFEALSRGAAWVAFIERAYPAAHTLLTQVKQFKVSARAFVYQQPYQETTHSQLLSCMPSKKAMDIIFLDPPFRKHMLVKSIDWLMQQSYVSKDTYLYIEHEKGLALSGSLTACWYPWRQRGAGQVAYGLWRQKHI